MAANGLLSILQALRIPAPVPYVAVLVEFFDEPSRFEQALLSAGWLDYGDADIGDWEYHFCNWHLCMKNRDDNGTLCSEDPRQTWKDEPPPAGIVRATTFAYPLAQITSSETLSAKIVQPLLDELAKEAKEHPSRGTRRRSRGRPQSASPLLP